MTMKQTQVHQAWTTFAQHPVESFASAPNDPKHVGKIQLLTAQVQLMIQRAGSTTIELDLETTC